MPRRHSVPSYRLHKSSGQAVVTLPAGLGGRRDVLLGLYGSPECRAEYARVLAEWQAADGRLPPRMTHPDLSVNELILPYWPHVETYYRQADGTPTSAVSNIRLALRRLRLLGGE